LLASRIRGIDNSCTCEASPPRAASRATICSSSWGAEQGTYQNQVGQAPFQRGKRFLGRSDDFQRAADARAENPLEDGRLRRVWLDGERVRIAGLVALIARLFGHGFLAHLRSGQWQFGYQRIFAAACGQRHFYMAPAITGLVVQ
jgi:hypothetical protein